MGLSSSFAAVPSDLIVQIFLRRAQRDGVKRVALGGEPHVLGGERLAFAFVETLRGKRRAFRGRAFAENFPRARAEDAFLVHVHPRGDALRAPPLPCHQSCRRRAREC